jgi:hypothetical protein
MLFGTAVGVLSSGCNRFAGSTLAYVSRARANPSGVERTLVSALSGSFRIWSSTGCQALNPGGTLPIHQIGDSRHGVDGAEFNDSRRAESAAAHGHVNHLYLHVAADHLIGPTLSESATKPTNYSLDSPLNRPDQPFEPICSPLRLRLECIHSATC